MKIKITALDKLFAQYIKLRDKFCQRCGGSGGLQTSHFWGRGRKSVRYDEDNAVLLCFGCHQYFHANPAEHRDWFLKHLGQDAFDMLEKRAQTIGNKPDLNLITLYLKAKLKELDGIK